MTRLSPEAEAQLDALLAHYERIGRPEAIYNLIGAVEEAFERIKNEPAAGLDAPRPYPALARFGFRWIKAGSYWFAYTDTEAVVTAIFYETANIPKRMV